jgi:hypothetical protein
MMDSWDESKSLKTAESNTVVQEVSDVEQVADSLEQALDSIQ